VEGVWVYDYEEAFKYLYFENIISFYFFLSLLICFQNDLIGAMPSFVLSFALSGR